MWADLELDVGQRNSRFPELNLCKGQWEGWANKVGPGIRGGWWCSGRRLCRTGMELLFSQRDDTR